MKGILQKFVSLAIALAAVGATAHAQGGTVITGRVTSDGGVGLGNATVFIQSLGAGTQTDPEGNYRFTVPGARVTGQTVTLTARLIGYTQRSVQVTLAPGQTVTENITLTVNPLRLGEVVVTGSGTVTAAERLGTVRTAIDPALIVRSNEQNVVQALAAKAPGVVVNQQSGDPGASSKVIIRGLNTIQGVGQPLIVVDGSPIDNSTNTTSDPTAGTVAPNRASDINPNDIENVEVLKSGAAAAIYGSNASQGVILITTKKGQPGQTRYSLRSSNSWDNVTNLPDLQRQFGQGSGGVTAVCTKKDCRLTGSSFGAPIPAGTTTYNNAGNLFERGRVSDNTLTISGGTDRTRYFLSGGSSNNNGIIVGGNDYYRRQTVRLNASQQVFTGLNVGANISYADVRGSFIQKGSNLSGLLLGAWRTPPTFNNFQYLDSATGLHRSYRFPNPSAGSTTSARGYDNPLFVINNQSNTSQVGRAFGNVNVNYDPSNWFSLRYILGSDYTSDERLEAIPKTSSSQPTGQVIRANFVNRNIDQILTASGTKNFSDNFQTKLIIGGNLNERVYRQNYATGVNLIADRPFSLDNTTQVTPNQYESLIRGQSYFASLQTSLWDQLFVTLTDRNDGYSTFGQSNRRNWFPSAQAAWTFTKLTDLGGALSAGRLRVAYGQTGTQPGVYLTSGYFSGGYFGGGWGDALYAIQNGRAGLTTAGRRPQNNLRPERQGEFETGIDLGFLKNRADLSFTYYDRIARDVIFDAPLPPSSGYSVQASNAGKLQNRGTELSLNLRPVQAANVDWNVGFQYARNRNRVLNLVGTNAVYLPTGGYFEGAAAAAVKGFPLGVFRGNDFARCRYGSDNIIDGVDINAACTAAKAPNGALYIGEDGFPVGDPALRVIGDPTPRWTGAVRSGLRVGKVQLSGLLDIRNGGQIWNGTKGALYNFGIHGNTRLRNVPVIFGQTFTPGSAKPVATPIVGPGAGQTVTLGQDWYQGLGSGFGPVASQFIEPGGFVKLRELAIGYTLDGGWVRNSLGLSSVDLRLAGRNLKTWTKYTGVDPETNLGGAAVAVSGIDYFNNPQTRSVVFTVGLNR